MSVRKYKTDPQVLLEKGRKLMSESDGTKFFSKVRAVVRVISGKSAAKVAEDMELCRATVSGWVKIADEQGFDALWETPRKGRPSKLSHEQYCELDEILQQSASKFGYKVWDGNSLSDLIKNRYGVSFKTRHCQGILHKLGFSLIRPQPISSKVEEHTEEREGFKKSG